MQVDSKGVGQRLDNFLFRICKGAPKSLIYRLLRTGQVRVNKKRAKPDLRLNLGDSIRLPPLQLSATSQPKVLNPRMLTTLRKHILFEDKHLLIIDKPTGMAVHGGSGVSIGVIEALRKDYPDLELIHRLDRDTSGCLMLAKKPSLLKAMHALLRNGEVEKTYLALVAGLWDSKQRFVDAPLLKNQLRSGERVVRIHPEGKAARSEFVIVQRFANASLVAVKLHTGRTHQIRVHCAHTGHPIAGDVKYGDKAFNEYISQLGCKRLFLHAKRLHFTLPTTGQVLTVTAPLPEELQQCLNKMLR